MPTNNVKVDFDKLIDISAKMLEAINNDNIVELQLLDEKRKELFCCDEKILIKLNDDYEIKQAQKLLQLNEKVLVKIRARMDIIKEQVNTIKHAEKAQQIYNDTKRN